MAIGDDFNGPGRSEPAPARPHEPFQKIFFFRRVRGAAGRPPVPGRFRWRRATESTPWLVGYPDRTGVGSGAGRGRPTPRPAMAAGVAHTTGGSSAVRTPARYPTRAPDPSDPAGRNADRESSAGAPGGHPGGCKRALERTFFSRAVCSPPTRPTRPRGSTTAGRDRIDALGRRLRQAGDVGWIANEADPGGACGRWRGQPGGGRRSTRPRGSTGRPPGGCKRALERTFFTRAACSPPRAIQGPKPFSNGLAPRSPATRARISSKAASPAESQGKRRIGAASTRIFR